jgi:hypothetical protein
VGPNRAIAKRHATVQVVNLPADCGVNGVDDLLVSWGPERVLDLFNSAVTDAHLPIAAPPQFDSRPNGMFRITGSNGRMVETQLTTYQAAIVTSICLDDGAETKREFEIEAQLHGRESRFTLAASDFARMDWPLEQLGPGAITLTNQRDYAKTAIQSVSLAAEERSICAHTGWRKIDNRWFFLHGQGAIGADGIVSDIAVRLNGSLDRYRLQLPYDPGRHVSAVRASLKLVELGPATICFPLLAATCRAVFGDADFAVHVAGPTGAFKSELATLFQQHFGPGTDSSPPARRLGIYRQRSRSRCFLAKDALFVIDDFAPHGSAVDQARYHGEADRVFRPAGNAAGRGRLDSAARLRGSKPPRALILSTGEEIPLGQSIRARLLILELSKSEILSTKLTECQQNALSGM